MKVTVDWMHFFPLSDHGVGPSNSFTNWIFSVKTDLRCGFDCLNTYCVLFQGASDSRSDAPYKDIER